MIGERRRTAEPAATESVAVSVVVPLYDEEANLLELYERLTQTLQAELFEYEIVFVDDGSKDRTTEMLQRICSLDHRVAALRLSRNFGHQAAVTAGLDHARGDAVIVMDGDLQDPPEVLPRFLRKWKEGFDVVYAVRRKRKENILKRFCYRGFYRLMSRVGEIDLPSDSGDFCLLDRKAVDALNRLPERSRFVRGLRRFVGFRQTGLEYERDRRAAGAPKYTFRKLFALAIDGLFNFSQFPLRLIAGAGLLSGVICMASCLMMIVQFQIAVAWIAAASGLLALQMLAMSILGEYLRRILVEVKARPTYIIEEVITHRLPSRLAA
jgi:dolichol-phosphate mannosyltransferase